MTTPEPRKVGNSEIRFHDDGTVDEIVIRDNDGKCLFHLEQMSDTLYWSALYDKPDGSDAVHVNFYSKNGRSHIEGRVND